MATTEWQRSIFNCQKRVGYQQDLVGINSNVTTWLLTVLYLFSDIKE